MVKTSPWKLTAQGAMVYLDMLKNPEEWKKLQIIPDYLDDPFKKHFEAVKVLYSSIQNDDEKIQLFKCLLYMSLMDENQLDLYPSIESIIKQNPTIIHQLSFEKIKRVWNNNLKNTVHLAYNDELLSSNNIVQVLLLQPYESDFQAADEPLKQSYSARDAFQYQACRSQGRSHEEALFWTDFAKEWNTLYPNESIEDLSRDLTTIKTKDPQFDKDTHEIQLLKCIVWRILKKQGDYCDEMYPIIANYINKNANTVPCAFIDSDPIATLINQGNNRSSFRLNYNNKPVSTEIDRQLMADLTAAASWKTIPLKSELCVILSQYTSHITAHHFFHNTGLARATQLENEIVQAQNTDDVINAICKALSSPSYTRAKEGTSKNSLVTYLDVFLQKHKEAFEHNDTLKAYYAEREKFQGNIRDAQETRQALRSVFR